MIRHNESVRLTIDPCAPRPSSAGPYVSPQLERAIAARWRLWVAWVCMYLLRARQADPTVNPEMNGPEFHRLCHRHREHFLDLTRDGISMRTIRRHRLDDPRLTDEVRAMLVEAARERQSKAWYRRPEDQRAEDRLATAIRLGPITRHTASVDSGNESPESCPQAEELVLDPSALKETIQTIRRLVCEYFYLREMRDPELTVRTNRRAYVLPRQIAMYIVRQVMGTSLEEIGREFGGRHYSTVLYSVNKIERMRRADEALNRTITQLTDAVVAHK